MPIPLQFALPNDNKRTGAFALIRIVAVGEVVGALSPNTPVHLFPVPHLDHKDEEDLILNLVDDAVVLPRPDVDAVELFLRCELLHPMRAGILLQAEEVRVYNLADMRVQLPNVPRGGWGQFDSIGQASVS